MMPTMLSLLMPAVIEGVTSLATSTVPAGASLILTSSMPRRIESRPSRISLTSVALCMVRSSPVAENMSMNILQICSTDASAH